jgi:hypothetical protein
MVTALFSDYRSRSSGDLKSFTIRTKPAANAICEPSDAPDLCMIVVARPGISWQFQEVSLPDSGT